VSVRVYPIVSDDGRRQWDTQESRPGRSSSATRSVRPSSVGRVGTQVPKHWHFGAGLCGLRQRGNDTEVAEALSLHRKTVGKWRNRFLEQRLEGLHDEPDPEPPHDQRRRCRGGDCEDPRTDAG